MSAGSSKTVSKQVCCVCGKDWALGHRCKPSKTRAQRIAERVVLGVCELPDYNSPEGQPDLVMCTVQQLEHCVLQAFEQLEYDLEMERGPPDETPVQSPVWAFVERVATYSDYTHDDVDELKILKDLQAAAALLYGDGSRPQGWWQCPCCQNYYTSERIVCPVSGDSRPAQETPASPTREEVERRAQELRETGVNLIPNSWRCQHGTVYAWPIAVAICGCERDALKANEHGSCADSRAGECPVHR